MPRPLPFGSGFDQPTFSAAKSSTPRKRAGSGSSSSLGFQFAGFTRSPRRNSTGSFPAAAASSSMKHSTANPLKECSTERHHSGGTELATALYSSRTLGMSYGICLAPPTSDSSNLSGAPQRAPMEVEEIV